MRSQLLLIVAGLGANAGVARAESVRHVPPAEAAADAPLEIAAEVTRAWESTLTLHYRVAGSDAWTDAPFTRKDGAGWIAVVPATAMVVPGVEYYIDSAAGDATEAEFASAARPHEVRILRTQKDERRDRELLRANGKRYRIRTAAEYVQYGSREIDPFGTIGDAYYRVDADVGYRLLAYPLEQIRVGYTRMIGDVPDTPLDNPAECRPPENPEDPNDCRLHVGFKVGGWFELRLGITDGIDLDVRGMAMATEVGVGVGGRAELRFGYEDGNHVAIGAESIQDTGTSGHFRLGWDTVPKLPMAATVEVTTMPSAGRDPAVRFVYDLAYPLPSGLRIGGRVGYQGRDADVGGLSAGGNLTIDF